MGEGVGGMRMFVWVCVGDDVVLDVNEFDGVDVCVSCC